jgi:hypothetical protein
MPKARKQKPSPKMPPEFDRLLGKLLSTPPVEAADLRINKTRKKKGRGTKRG